MKNICQKYQLFFHKSVYTIKKKVKETFMCTGTSMKKSHLFDCVVLLLDFMRELEYY